GDLDGLVDVEGGAIVGIRDVKLFEHVAEPAPVFRDIHAVEGSADDPYPFFAEFFGEFEGRLAAELYDDAFGLLVLDDLPGMFPVNGLEIKFVGDSEVRGYRFGVAVHHDGLVAAFPDGEQAVDAAVVEFDALADAVGAAAENDDLLLIADLAFIGMTAFESGV